MAILRSGAPSMRRAEGGGARRSVPSSAATPAKKKLDSQAAWREFRELVWVHRRRLSIGLTLMLISRLAGIVIPALSKYVIDDVLRERRNHDAGEPADQHQRQADRQAAPMHPDQFAKLAPRGLRIQFLLRGCRGRGGHRAAAAAFGPSH